MITPEGEAPNPDAKAETGLEVRVVNNGTRYFAAGRLGWQITGADKAGQTVIETYQAFDMSEKIGMGIVAPGKARIFFIPMERELRDGDGDVSINFRR